MHFTPAKENDVGCERGALCDHFTAAVFPECLRVSFADFNLPASSFLFWIMF